MCPLTNHSFQGPFTFVSNKTGSDNPFITIAEGIKNYPPGYQYADATLFTDPDPPHKSYVYWRTRMTTGLNGPTGFRGMQLAEDCLSVLPESDTRITETPNREVFTDPLNLIPCSPLSNRDSREVLSSHSCAACVRGLPCSSSTACITCG